MNLLMKPHCLLQVVRCLICVSLCLISSSDWLVDAMQWDRAAHTPSAISEAPVIALPISAIMPDNMFAHSNSLPSYSDSTATSFPMNTDIRNNPACSASSCNCPAGGASECTSSGQCLCGSVLIIMGGLDSTGNPNNDMYMATYPPELDRSGKLAWNFIPPTGNRMASRSEFTCDRVTVPSSSELNSTTSEMILCFGGQDTLQQFSSLWLFDPRSNIQSGLGPPPIPQATCFPLQPELNQRFARTVDMCAIANYYNMTDVNGCSWPSIRSLHSSIVIDDYLYIFGGSSIFQTMGDLWKLKLDSSIVQQSILQASNSNGEYVIPARTCPLTWTLLTEPGGGAQFPGAGNSSAPTPRFATALSSLGTKLYFLGGTSNGQDASFEEVWMIDVAADELSWFTINNISPPNLPKPEPAPWSRLQTALLPLTNQLYNTTSQSLISAPSSMASGTRTGFVCFGGIYVPQIQNPDNRVWVALPCESITPSVGDCTALSLNLYWFPLPLVEGTGLLGSFGAQSFTWMFDHQYLFGFGLKDNEEPLKDVYRVDLSIATGPRVELLQQPPIPSYVTCATCSNDEARAGCGRSDLMPPARWGAQAHLIGRTVYMWGGVNDTLYQPLDMWTYNVDRDVWKLLPAGSGPNTAAKLPLVGFIGKNMFTFFGVLNLVPINQVFHYDMDLSIWSNITLSVRSDTPWNYALNGSDSAADDLGGYVKRETDGKAFLYPQPRFYTKLVRRGVDELVMYGGMLQYQALLSGDLWSFNTTSLRWRFITAFNRTQDSLQPVLNQRCTSSHTLVIDKSGDNLVVAFGLNSGGSPTALVWRYHFPTAKWIGVALNQDAYSTPVQRYDPQSAVIGNAVYIFSGLNDSPLEDLWKLDMNIWEWTRLDGAASYLPTLATMPFGRSQGAMIGLPFINAIFMFGGMNSQSFNDLHIFFVDEYQVADTTLPDTIVAHDALRFVSFDQTMVLLQPTSNMLSPFPLVVSATISSLIAYSQSINSGFIAISLLNAACFGACSNTSLSSNSSSMTRFSALRAIAQPMRIQTSQSAAGVSVGGNPTSDAFSRLVIDCAQDRCFRINTAFTTSPVEFMGLEFRNGFGIREGGAITISNSTVSFENCAFISNSAGQRGGAISATTSTLRIKQSEFRENSAVFLGGAVYVSTGTLHVSDSLFDGNRIIQDELAGFGLGGAVFLLSTPFDARNTNWSFNVANRGGAVMSASVLSVVPVLNPVDPDWVPTTAPPPFYVESCTFQHNRAKLQGGAILLTSLFADPAWYQVAIVNSTFDSSYAAHDGGAIYLDGSLCQLVNSSFANNGCGGGGASVYSYITDNGLLSVVSPDAFSQRNQVNNSAMYGPTFASIASNLRIIDDRAQWTPQDSGSFISPPLILTLVDVYGSVVTTDSSSFVSITPTASFAGATTVQLQGGVANFSALKLNLPPNQSVKVNFTCSLPLLSYDERNSTILLTSAPCRPGQQNVGLSCQDCQAGAFSQQTMSSNCTSCLEGTHQPTIGQSSCLLCPPGSFASGRGTITCSTCPPGLFSWFDGSTTCVPCDEGLECDGNGKVISLAGRYVLPIPANATHGFNPVSISCPFGNCLSNFTCAHDRLPYASNPLCAACVPGFSDIEHECVDCSSVQWLKVFGIAILFLLCTLLLHVLAQNTSSASLLQIFLYWTQISQLQTGSSASAWLSWLHIFQISLTKSTGSTCVIPLDAYGTMSIELLSPAIFSLALIALVGMATLWRSEVVHQCRNRCIDRMEYPDQPADDDAAAAAADANDGQSPSETVEDEKDEQRIRSDGNAAAAATPMSSATFSNYHHLRKAWIDRFRSLQPIPFDSVACSRTMISIFLFTYNTVSQSVFNHLTCVSLGESLPRVVYLDGTMDCDSSTYKVWLSICIIVLVCFVIGIPVALAVKLRRMQSTLPTYTAVESPASSSSSTLILPRSQSRILEVPLNDLSVDQRLHETLLPVSPSDSFPSHNKLNRNTASLKSEVLPPHVSPFSSSPYRLLFESYGPHSYLWQLVILLRRAVYVGLNAAFASTPSARFFSFSLLSSIIFALHMLVQPYRTESDNRAESVSLFLCMVIASVMMFAQSQSQSSRSEGNGTVDTFALPTRVILFMLMLIPTLAFIGMLIRSYWKRRQAAKQMMHATMDHEKLVL